MTVKQGSELALLYEEIDRYEDIMREWRRYLHEHPELSFEEVNTARFIAKKLKKFGYDVQAEIGGHGLTATLHGSREGKTIVLRADFDALPIQDEKDVAYQSNNPGVMHACGHDGHTAALLGTAAVLSKHKERIKGKVKFVFQPAEEKPPGGAKFMIEEGILKDVDYVFAAHLASDIPLGKVGLGSGYQMAAVDKFTLRIKGRGGHGAKPDETIDALVIGTSVVEGLQKIVSRKISPLDAAVVTIGSFHAGNAFNVIPDQAVIEGTVRTYDANVRDRVEEEIASIVKGITEAYHATYDIDYLRGYPALFNHEAETNAVRALLTEVFTEEDVLALEPSMGAEDFAYFLEARPGTYFRVGSRTEKENTHYPHHHPKFDFDERALTHISKAFLKIIDAYLLEESVGGVKDEK